MDRLFQNDEKLLYLHYFTKIMFLVSNEKMGLCLYMNTKRTMFTKVNIINILKVP